MRPADPDETLGHTQAIMGTPAYMAPEQLSGEQCDQRTDIFALGLLLCEMATRRRASAGEALASELPPHLAHVIQHCLSRDPAARWQSAADVKLALEWSGIAEESRSSSPRSVEGRLMRLTVVLGPDAVPGLRTTVVLSNDGRQMAFLARGPDGIPRLATRPFDEVQHALLQGTENAQDPFFSPDGQWLGFFADYKLKRVSIHGGSPFVLCEAPNGRGASWGSDDGIVVAPHIHGGLFRIAAGGGAPKPLTHPKGDEVSHAWPQVLPGGETVLFTATAGNHSSIQVASVRTGETKVVQGPGYRGRYLSSGHVVFVHQSTMFAVPFDMATLDARRTRPGTRGRCR